MIGVNENSAILDVNGTATAIQVNGAISIWIKGNNANSSAG